jgi:hypothetical protein
MTTKNRPIIASRDSRKERCCDVGAADGEDMELDWFRRALSRKPLTCQIFCGGILDMSRISAKRIRKEKAAPRLPPLACVKTGYAASADE